MHVDKVKCGVQNEASKGKGRMEAGGKSFIVVKEITFSDPLLQRYSKSYSLIGHIAIVD